MRIARRSTNAQRCHAEQSHQLQGKPGDIGEPERPDHRRRRRIQVGHHAVDHVERRAGRQPRTGVGVRAPVAHLLEGEHRDDDDGDHQQQEAGRDDREPAVDRWDPQGRARAVEMAQARQACEHREADDPEDRLGDRGRHDDRPATVGPGAPDDDGSPGRKPDRQRDGDDEGLGRWPCGRRDGRARQPTGPAAARWSGAPARGSHRARSRASAIHDAQRTRGARHRA